jgi:hypothetical protein
MIFHIGLENNIEGRSMAWVLGHPGCFAYGEAGAQALAAVPAAIREYVGCIDERTSESWLAPEHIEVLLDQTWQVYDIDDDYQLVESGYSVNAWFRHDWLPLTAEEVNRGLMLLTWSREGLLDTVRDLSPHQLEKTFPDEKWDIAGVLRHVGGAEWWYLDRLGLAIPHQEVPDEPFERLEKVRLRLREVLPGLAGSTQVVGVEGEFWSPRKLLRRAVWHERDHEQHIRKLLVQL